jgi:hypothetical protein
MTPRLPDRPDTLKEKIARTRAVNGISREMAGSRLEEMTHELKDELYLLSDDPKQKVNLVSEEKEVVKELRGKFDQFFEFLCHS